MQALPPSDEAPAPKGGTECLNAQGFGVAFGQRVILAEVGLSLQAGAITALMGPAGTGKSTLLRSWAGLNDRNPRYKWWGAVDYRGQPLAEGNRPLLVQQHVHLMQSSVRDALTEPARQQWAIPRIALDEWATDLVVSLGFPELTQHFERVTVDLPPVLQRAVAILRKAACAPALLMVDEPTFGLSDYDAFLLLDLLRNVGARSSVLVVLHNQKHARSIATDVMLLAGGRIQEDASAERFFAAPRSSIAQQFVATGSCFMPAPDADPSDLGEDIEPPPPLPTIAQLAVQAAPESLGPRGFTWIVPGKLAGTPMPGAIFEIDYDLQALKAVGITCLITLTENDLPQEALARNGLTNVHLPIRDREPPSIPQINMLLMRMESLLRRGEVLAAHCLAGIGRTGTVLASWLIREGLTASEALKRVRRIEPKFVQTLEQEEFLQRYEDSILRKLAS